MKINLTSFTVLLIFGMALFGLAVWYLSLHSLLDRHNQLGADASRQNWQSQILQLQQKQRLWLQSQYYLLDRLVERGTKPTQFQAVLWDYYQTNPGIRAVSLVYFDEQGQPVMGTSHSSCPSSLRLRRFDLEGIGGPRVVDCRTGDDVLLEISGPVEIDGQLALLLLSMDYFAFLSEFSMLIQRDLRRTGDINQIFQYEEFGSSAEPGLRLTVPLGNNSVIYAELHLQQRPTTFGEFFMYQAWQVLVLFVLMALLAVLLMHLGLLRPLNRLAVKMHKVANSHREPDSIVEDPLRPGLATLFDYCNMLQTVSRRDSVTGLSTRIIFEDRLARAILDGRRNARKYALVMVDIRGLDEVAQRHGQYLTDALLKQIAENFREGLRETDNIARFERNLFALLVEVQESDQLKALIEKIYLSVIRRYLISGRELEIGAAMGVAIFPDHAVDADGLYQRASDALLRSDQHDWPIIFSPHPVEDTDTSSFSVVQALRRAIDHDGLSLVFQPVVDMNTHESVYFEALLRWKESSTQNVSISRTIELAERNHLIKPLTNWTFESSCRFIGDAGIPGLTVGINLSMIDLHDRELPDRIESCLRKFKVDPAQIVIEITEGQIMQDPDQVISVLAHLGIMGLSLSIDDFGTGQASLTYLKELPVEKLKIDQSFIRDIANNPDDQLIVKGTIELSHTLDLKVVAEGVETIEVYELLREMNCDYAQGHYISFPIAPSQVATWCERTTKVNRVRSNK